MRRVAHLLLLVFAVVGLSATADRGVERLDALTAPGATSDSSHQLGRSLPAAHIDRATLTTVEGAAPCDRVDARTRQLVAAVLPTVGAANGSGVCESAPGAASIGIGTVATCPCGRGPPVDPAPTSI